MAAVVYKNASGHARTWLTLAHPDTGRTLHLEPGEKVKLDLPADFNDPHLQPAEARTAKKRPSRARAKKPQPQADKPSADTTTSEE